MSWRNATSLPAALQMHVQCAAHRNCTTIHDNCISVFRRYDALSRRITCKIKIIRFTTNNSKQSSKLFHRQRKYKMLKRKLINNNPMTNNQQLAFNESVSLSMHRVQNCAQDIQQHAQHWCIFTDTSTQTDWTNRDLQSRGTEKTTERWIYFRRQVSCLSNKISSPTSLFPSLYVRYPKIKTSQITANPQFKIKCFIDEFWNQWIKSGDWLKPSAQDHTAKKSEKLKKNIWNNQ